MLFTTFRVPIKKIITSENIWFDEKRTLSMLLWCDAYHPALDKSAIPHLTPVIGHLTTSTPFSLVKSGIYLMSVSRMQFNARWKLNSTLLSQASRDQKLTLNWFPIGQCCHICALIGWFKDLVTHPSFQQLDIGSGHQIHWMWHLKISVVSNHWYWVWGHEVKFKDLNNWKVYSTWGPDINPFFQVDII